MSTTVIFILAVIAILIFTSIIIHNFFPKLKKYEPLMLLVEFASLLLIFID